MDPRDTEALRRPRRSSPEDHFRATAVMPADFDVLPAGILAPANAQGLHHRLLGGKSSRVALAAGTTARFTIRQLPRPEDPGAETVSMETIDGAQGALDTREIHAGPDDHPISKPHN